jgi:hypothetical protein
VAAMTDQWLAMVPTVSPSAVTWPSRFQIKVPLVHDQRWQFYEPFRTVRRLVKRFTSRRDKPPASAPPRCAG